MKILIILAFAILANSMVISAQPSTYDLAKNEMKYWKLRGRLIGDDNNKDVYNGFMTVGSGAGMSIPSEKRHPIDRRDFWMYDPQYSDPNTRQQKIITLELQK